MSTDRLFRRIWNSLTFASVTQADDSGSVMMLQATTGSGATQQALNLPAPQQFGFSSVPPIGSDAAAHFVGGDRSNGVITATNHQASRPTGKLPGESMQFNAFGMQVYLTENGITINGGGKAITITNAPTLTQNGDIHATGEIIRGFGTGDQVTLGEHRHGTGTSAAGTITPTPGT